MDKEDDMQQAQELKTVLQRLQDWYAKQCDGDWEHQFGVSIVSTDNPGWHVKIDLKGTKWEDATFKGIRTRASESDWIMCSKEKAYGPNLLVHSRNCVSSVGAERLRPICL